MAPDAEDVLGDPLRPSPVGLRHEEPPDVLKKRLRDNLSPSEPLRSNIKRIGYSHTGGDDRAQIVMHGFTREIAERLGEFVEDWHVSPRPSEYEGVWVRVNPGEYDG